MDSTGATTTREYVTQNGKIVRETITGPTTVRVLDFIYDASGRPFAFKYSLNGAAPVTLYYVLNLQGDVVKVVAESGMIVANYTYNAWGEILSVTTATGAEITNVGHIGMINPLRYRGYYYDSETGFYYLQSRYYDPTMHRFINADSLAGTGQGVLGHNMFAYCLNNPLAYMDESGNVAISFINGNEAGLYGGGGQFNPMVPWVPIVTPPTVTERPEKIGNSKTGYSEVGAAAKTLCSQEAIDNFCDITSIILLPAIVTDAVIQSMEIEMSVGHGVAAGGTILNLGVEVGANFDCMSFSYNYGEEPSFGMQAKAAMRVSAMDHTWEYGVVAEWKNGGRPSFSVLCGDGSFTLLEVNFYSGVAGASFAISVDTDEFWSIISRAFSR